MLALLTVLVLGQAAAIDGGVATDAPVRDAGAPAILYRFPGCAEWEKAPPAVPLDGGAYYLPADRASLLACERKACGDAMLSGGQGVVVERPTIDWRLTAIAGALGVVVGAVAVAYVWIEVEGRRNR